jgi:hypothetical protein
MLVTGVRGSRNTVEWDKLCKSRTVKLEPGDSNKRETIEWHRLYKLRKGQLKPNTRDN